MKMENYIFSGTVLIYLNNVIDLIFPDNLIKFTSKRALTSMLNMKSTTIYQLKDTITSEKSFYTII